MKNIGEIIRFLRKSKNLSQENLSDLVGCSREFISQVERNKCNLPDYLLLPLSNFLTFDIPRLIKNIDKYNNFEHYILSCELIDLIEKNDNYGISTLLNNKIIINEFNYGYTNILKIYCMALVEKHINNNLNLSTKLCLQQLKISDISNIDEFIPKLSQEDRYYSTILVLGANLHIIGDFKHHKILLNNTIDFLEQNIFNDLLPNSTISYYFKKFYIICLNNYADVHFTLNDLNNALIYCDKAIYISTKNNILFMLHLILKLKIEILYLLDKVDEAKEIYTDFKSICRLMQQLTYFESSSEKFKIQYPRLFD